jgi:hypothetical protein
MQSYQLLTLCHAVFPLQVLLSTAAVDDKSPALDFLKGKDAPISVSGITATLLNYLPPLIILLHYLMPYLSAYKAGNLTGTLLKMGSKGTETLVKNGRECLIAVMLLGHFLGKLVESASCKNPSKASTNGAKRFTSGIAHAVTCLIITTVSVRRHVKTFFPFLFLYDDGMSIVVEIIDSYLYYHHRCLGIGCLLLLNPATNRQLIQI